jgi:hypothetical protein
VKEYMSWFFLLDRSTSASDITFSRGNVGVPIPRKTVYILIDTERRYGRCDEFKSRFEHAYIIFDVAAFGRELCQVNST